MAGNEYERIEREIDENKRAIYDHEKRILRLEIWRNHTEKPLEVPVGYLFVAGALAVVVTGIIYYVLVVILST